jgi:thiol:disulfide interchange protein DsbD
MRTYLTLCRVLLLTLLLATVTTSARASESGAQDTGHVVAQMVTSHDRVSPGQNFFIALSTTMDDHWHIYWKNPGDAGEPVAVHWDEYSDVQPGEIVWPLPTPILTGPIMNYGFDGRALFPMPVTMPLDAVIGSVISFDAEVTYLVCKDVCIPEMATLSVAVEVGDPLLDNRWAFNIETALAVAPIMTDISAGAFLDNGRLRLDIEIDASAIETAYFFPELAGYINHSAPQEIRIAERGLQIDLEAGFVLESGLNDPLTGVLRTETMSGDVQGIWLTAIPNTIIDLGKIKTVSGGQANASNLTIWTALIGAFLGGLILNLMPCVFPVISMKALSFARHAHDDGAEIKRQGWLYTIGVLTTFLILTAVLLILKSAGSKIGWGFQLQNPVVIAGLALMFFAIALNLLGVFEIKLGAQNAGEALTRKPGAAGSFFTGVLAVIVATPCTAPFMAGAIGFALVQPAFVTLVVFLALGIGFAMPFLALSYWPGLLKRLPKPGPWMETFKQVMAFFMFAAVIWLIWVLSFQTSESGIAKTLAAMLAFGFGVFIWQRSKSGGKIVAIVSFIATLALVFSMRTAIQNTADLQHEAWSPQRVAELRADGNAVFVDFTAAWCVTCKVNEQLVLNGAGELFARHNTVVLVADWTNKNDEIADELTSYGRSGVPLYLLFPPGNNPVKAAVLPQVLTKSVLKKALLGNDK